MKRKFFNRSSALIIASLFFLPGQSFSQAKPDTSHFFNVDTLKVRLGLTDEQTAKISALMKTIRDQRSVKREQMSKDRAADKGERQAMKSARKSMLEKTEQEILALLTAEQKIKYETLKKEHLAHVKPRSKPAKKTSTP